MSTLSTKNEQKGATIFICKKCDYNTCKPCNFKRHLLTPKHLKSTHVDIINENEPELNIFICNQCNKTYKERTGLWKHKQKCHNETKRRDDSDSDSDSDGKAEFEVDSRPITTRQLVFELIKQNKELQTQILELANKSSTNNSNNNNHNTTNNSHNKTFNMQFFLNDTCKDAMNIGDFIDGIQLKLSDLERFGYDGYVEGVSHILVRELNNVDVTKRPIHCSDVKRQTFYVKENNEWEKETHDKPHLTKAIRTIEKKNMLMLNEFQKAHPDFMDYHSKINTQYNKIIINAVGVFDTVEEKSATHNKIFGKVSDATVIDKEQYLI